MVRPLPDGHTTTEKQGGIGRRPTGRTGGAGRDGVGPPSHPASGSPQPHDRAAYSAVTVSVTPSASVTVTVTSPASISVARVPNDW
ncbi:hypothetical protein M2316_003823 [Cellulosimicrobium cellulans]|nr:hypothetical protein [Cellulosimicrobium cellulans]